MDFFKTYALPLFTFVVLLVSANAKKLTEVNEENCEVCVKFLTKFMDKIEPDVKNSPEKIEDEFRKFCKNAKKAENRFCYYIGGLEESATGILGEMSKPISWGMPADKICMKIYRKDEQICDLKYEKTIDYATVDLKKLKVKDLKKILEDWDTSCKGCTEKSEFIQLIEDLMPQYAPEAAEKRRKARQEL